jgi:hypothetical protein
VPSSGYDRVSRRGGPAGGVRMYSLTMMQSACLPPKGAQSALPTLLAAAGDRMCRSFLSRAIFRISNALRLARTEQAVRCLGRPRFICDRPAVEFSTAGCPGGHLFLYAANPNGILAGSDGIQTGARRREKTPVDAKGRPPNVKCAAVRGTRRAGGTVGTPSRHVPAGSRRTPDRADRAAAPTRPGRCRAGG